MRRCALSKQSGLGDYLFIDGKDWTGDVGTATVRSSSALLDATGLDKSAHERIYGLHDGGIGFTTFFNDVAAGSHLGLRALAQHVEAYFKNLGRGNRAAGLVAKQVSYDPARGADGSLIITIDSQADSGYGTEWGEQLTAGKQTDASAASSTGLDGGAASALGISAYIHVFSIGSGSPSVKIQESSDDGGSDAYADVTGGSFGAVSAGTAARIQTAVQSVERYLRVVSTGTFTNLVYAVMVCREPVGA